MYYVNQVNMQLWQNHMCGSFINHTIGCHLMWNKIMWTVPVATSFSVAVLQMWEKLFRFWNCKNVEWGFFLLLACLSIRTLWQAKWDVRTWYKKLLNLRLCFGTLGFLYILSLMGCTSDIFRIGKNEVYLFFHESWRLQQFSFLATPFFLRLV